MQYFATHDIDTDNPKRDPVCLKDLITDLNLAQEEDDFMDDNLDDLRVQEAICEIWKEIEDWYKENIPTLLTDLHGSATEQEIIEFESLIGTSLPVDYKSSIQIHNGEVYLHDYEYLSLNRVRGIWLDEKRYCEDGTYSGRTAFEEGQGIIQNRWWRLMRRVSGPRSSKRRRNGPHTVIAASPRSCGVAHGRLIVSGCSV